MCMCKVLLRCAALRIKKALGIFRKLVTTRRTTRVACDPPFGSEKNSCGIARFRCLSMAFLFKMRQTDGIARDQHDKTTACVPGRRHASKLYGLDASSFKAAYSVNK